MSKEYWNKPYQDRQMRTWSEPLTTFEKWLYSGAVIIAFLSLVKLCLH